MIYTVADRPLFERYFDDLCGAALRMVRKTGGHGQNAEIIMKMMMSTVGNWNGFLLIVTDDNDKFKGYVFAVLVPSGDWMDVVSLYMPNFGKTHKHEAFKYMKDWARANGCKAILAGVTRRPDHFLKWFYEPLGFKNIGLIIEHKLED